jgi:hypothetical protein
VPVRTPLLLACLAALAVLATACRIREPTSLPDPSRLPDDAPDPFAPVDVASLSREVASVRHLALRAPVRARGLDDAPFRERLLARRAAPGTPRGLGSALFWSAFAFAPPSVPLREVSRRVVEEQVVGFYDSDEKSLFVRGASGEGARIVPRHHDDRFVLAHEIEHALQDQNLGLALPKDVGDDATLAYRALAEGDASLTQIAVKLRTIPGTDHWVSRISGALHATTPGEIERRAGVKANELQSAPPLLRRVMTFPYIEGLSFVTDLYRAGGLRLVDRAFASPPRSTEQILHSEKYVAGELPVPVVPPVPPAGWKTVTSGTLGELQTGILLGQCVPEKEALAAASGWGGDAYSLVSDEQGHTGVLWSTTWDDEDAADRFHHAIAARVDCLRDATLAPSVGRDVTILREGRRIAYVQGLGNELGFAVSRNLLALPLDAPANDPPLGAVTIPPVVVPEKEFLHKGAYRGRVWVSETLGASLRLPTGFRAMDESSLEARMVHTSGAIAALQVLMRSPNERAEHHYLRSLLEEIRTALRKYRQPLDFYAEDSFFVAGVQGDSYTWRAPSGMVLRVVFVPACDRKATVVVVNLWRGDRGETATAEWTKGITLPSELSPACRWLLTATD